MRLRSVARGVAGWVFGLSVTIFLIAGWGRAVIIDTDTLAESLAPMSASSSLLDTVADWLVEEASEAGVDPTVARGAIEEVLGTTAVGDAMESLVSAVVEAAADPDPDGASVDVAAILMPAVPEITQSLESVGIFVGPDVVAGVVEELDPLVVRGESDAPLVGRASPAAGRLGTAAVLALVSAVLSALLMVVLSDDRLSEIKSVLWRVSVSAFTFGIILRLGAWVLDPRGGRAPVSESLSLVASSKWLVPLAAAGIAGAGAGGAWLLRRRLRRLAEDVGPIPESPPDQGEAQIPSLSSVR